MSHPKQKSKFDMWYKAMVAGATVDKPDYGKNSRTAASRKSRRTGTAKRGNHMRRKKRRKQKKDA